jgi:hypothetical protein
MNTSYLADILSHHMYIGAISAPKMQALKTSQIAKAARLALRV